MICRSSDELGLDGDHSGIMVLGQDALPGTPIALAISRPTMSFSEIGITPNRGDALSHIGTARDIAAATGRTLQTPTVDFPAVTSPPEPFEIQIQDSTRCPRYSAAILDGCPCRRFTGLAAKCP
jgi:phenylalanyl-tRNA synthetase beta chain